LWRDGYQETQRPPGKRVVAVFTVVRVFQKRLGRALDLEGVDKKRLTNYETRVNVPKNTLLNSFFTSSPNTSACSVTTSATFQTEAGRSG
jgi:hypothetical protein